MTPSPAPQEEADQILFLGLRDVLGADDLPADLAASRDVGCDLFVRCCARCLRAIAPADDDAAVPDRLPADMSGRFRVGTELAVRIQRLGYRGDLGFHQLLYPNEADVRRVLTFLLDKVPKASASAAPTSGGATSASARVQAALRAWVADGDKAAEPPAPQPFWTQPLSADDARVLVTSQAQPAARLTPSLLEAAASSAMLAARGAESELTRLSATPGAPSSAMRAAAVRAAIAAGLGQKAVRRAAAAGDDSRASRRPDASAAVASPEAAPDVALTAEARLARGEEEVAALQAQLQRALDDFAAAEASAAAAEEEEAAAQRDAAAASAATPALEQEYLLRKQTAALLSVRQCHCASHALRVVPCVLTCRMRPGAGWPRAGRERAGACACDRRRQAAHAGIGSGVGGGAATIRRASRSARWGSSSQARARRGAAAPDADHARRDPGAGCRRPRA